MSSPQFRSPQKGNSDAMQAAELCPSSLENREKVPHRENEIALWVENVSKTFTRSDKKAEKRSRPKNWRERMRWNPRLLRADKKKVVDSISLYAKRGEALGILGPNGCGKSTLVRMISTLLIPDEGRVEVFGLDVVRDAMAVKRLINRVSVDAAFFKKLSALENRLYTARLYDVEPGSAMKKA